MSIVRWEKPKNLWRSIDHGSRGISAMDRDRPELIRGTEQAMSAGQGKFAELQRPAKSLLNWVRQVHSRLTEYKKCVT